MQLPAALCPLFSGYLYGSKLISGENHLSRTPYRIYRAQEVMKMKDTGYMNPKNSSPRREPAASLSEGLR
jgi:hypothetical protein